MAVVLAVIPYFIFRWVIEGVSRWFARKASRSQA